MMPQKPETEMFNGLDGVGASSEIWNINETHTRRKKNKLSMLSSIDAIDSSCNLEGEVENLTSNRCGRWFGCSCFLCWYPSVNMVDLHPLAASAAPSVFSCQSGSHSWPEWLFEHRRHCRTTRNLSTENTNTPRRQTSVIRNVIQQDVKCTYRNIYSDWWPDR